MPLDSLALSSAERPGSVLISSRDGFIFDLQKISDFEFRISDFVLRISSIALSAPAYARKNSKQLPGLPQEPFSLLNIPQVSFIADLQPKTTLRTLLLNNANLMNEVCS